MEWNDCAIEAIAFFFLFVFAPFGRILKDNKLGRMFGEKWFNNASTKVCLELKTYSKPLLLHIL